MNDIKDFYNLVASIVLNQIPRVSVRPNTSLNLPAPHQYNIIINLLIFFVCSVIFNPFIPFFHCPRPLVVPNSASLLENYFIIRYPPTHPINIHLNQLIHQQNIYLVERELLGKRVREVSAGEVKKQSSFISHTPTLFTHPNSIRFFRHPQISGSELSCAVEQLKALRIAYTTVFHH